MVCAEEGNCDFAENIAASEITGRATTHMYGFEGAFAAVVVVLAVGVLVLYKLRT